jgi:hypothetical protein
MLPITFDLAKLITVFNDSLFFGVNTEWVKPAPTELDPYPSDLYLSQDPLLNHFEDAVVIEENRKTVTRWQDGWQPREIIVQKLYSESNDATWARAYVPDGTYVFIRDQDTLGGTQPVRGMIRARGEDYFWVQSELSIGNTASQACISIPMLSIDSGHDLYEHLCTGLT